MNAKKVYEKLGFERGQEPKQSMEIGQARDKKKLLSMMNDPGKFPSSGDAKIKFDYMIKVINDPTTKVRFEKKHESAPGDGRIIITLPPSPINVFFFSAMEENLGRVYDIEAYPWDNPTDNSMNIWINS
jgi:hypothetical protein